MLFLLRQLSNTELLGVTALRSWPGDFLLLFNTTAHPLFVDKRHDAFLRQFFRDVFWPE